MRKGLLIVISGPSGTGKGTVCEVVRKKNPDIAELKTYIEAFMTEEPEQEPEEEKNPET